MIEASEFLSNPLSKSTKWTRIVHTMSSIQIKLTLSPELKNLLKKQSERFGLTMASYVKGLIVQDIKESFPIEKNASQSVEDNYQKAQKRRSQSQKIANVEKFLEQL